MGVNMNKHEQDLTLQVEVMKSELEQLDNGGKTVSLDEVVTELNQKHGI